MDLIKDILAGKNFDEPSSVGAVKKYIKNNFNSEASVALSQSNIIVSVRSSALAYQIRLRQVDLAQKCDLGSLKLIIRIV